MDLSNEDRERLIRDSIKSAIAKKIKLSNQTWGISWSNSKEEWICHKDKCCCALACVLIENQDKVKKFDWRSWMIRSILQVDDEWIADFIRGFDGYSNDKKSYSYELGLLLGKELLNA